MQLHGTPGLAVLGPVEDLRAQIDHGAVQTKQPVRQLQPWGVFGLRELCREARAELQKQGLVDLPGPVLVGVGQCRMLGRFPHVEVAQLTLGRPQSLFDIAQTLGLSQLAKQHRHERVPRAETARMALAAMRIHSVLEHCWRDEL